MALFRSNRHGRLVIAYMVIGSLFGLAAPCLIFADEMPKESVLALSMANKAIQAALEACKKDGYRSECVRGGSCRRSSRDGTCRWSRAAHGR